VPSRASRFLARLPRPTRSAALFLLLATILELVGRLINSTGVTIASAAAVGAVISDGLLTPGVRLGTIRRQVPSRMTVGIPVVTKITIEAHSRRRFGSRRPVVLIDRPAGLEPGRIVTPALRAGTCAVADRLAVPLRRGHYCDGGDMIVEAYSPLGGFVRRATRTFDSSWYIHPAAAAPLRLPETAGGDLLGATASRRTGSGTDFFGIREWRGGDPTSAIHWRASARRDQLVVLERERPGRPALLVVVGLGRDGDEWEHCLARVAATAVRALRSARPVVLIAGAESVTPSTPRDLLDWFAAVRSATTPDLDALRTALRVAGRDATLLWIGAEALPEPLARVARASGVGAVVPMLAAGKDDR
jgi:uncharacterized protein (DUF58 family)